MQKEFYQIFLQQNWNLILNQKLLLSERRKNRKAERERDKKTREREREREREGEEIEKFCHHVYCPQSGSFKLEFYMLTLIVKLDFLNYI